MNERDKLVTEMEEQINRLFGKRGLDLTILTALQLQEILASLYNIAEIVLGDD